MPTAELETATKWLLWAAFVLMMLVLLFCPSHARAQALPLAGDPVVVQLTARDENGVVLYHRTGYLFFTAPLEYGVGDTHLVARDEIIIQRVLREEGERCNPVLPTDIRETCAVTYDYCGAIVPPVRKR